ncbi:MAG TPA: RNA polymerase sigma factor [Candidatus Hydrogenedentes bacterium]|nr:MAG: RNA polymerase sigma factor [Candidatus Hydrogenedentes bacterium ADurb.Bin179]HOH30066.1 RNA polymerase sigma factor [Candidatus Hydrogenedentota bacterium]
MDAAEFQKYRGLSDQNLIACIVGGDTMAAVALLIDQCGPRLKYLTQCTFSMLGIEFDEIVSATFLILRKNDWRALRSFRGRDERGRSCRLKTYVSVIAARMLWKKLDRAMKGIDWKATPITLDGLKDVPAPPDRVLRAAELMDAIMALENPCDRELLLLYKLQGWSAEEVAARLNISTANVYTRCNRALKQLRTLLEEGSRHA